MIVKNILNHAIKNKRKIYFDINQQLLIYIKDERRIRKSGIIKTIEMGFIFLSKRNKLVIFVPTSSITSSINKSMIHTTPEINN